MTKDTFGPMSLTPLMRFDLDSASWRTCEATSLWDLEMSSPTFPEWGTMRAGVLYALPTPERPTVEHESSSLRNLPTPTANDGSKASSNPATSARRREAGHQEALTDIVLTDLLPAGYLLPTPTASRMESNRWGESKQTAAGRPLGQTISQLSSGSMTPSNPTANSSAPNLWDILTLLPTPTAQAAKHGATPDLTANSFGSNLWDLPHLLPTPTVMDMGANYTPEEWEAWKAQQRAAHRNGNGHGASLTQEAFSLLGTPRSQMGSMTSKPNARLETDIGQLTQEAVTNWGKYGPAIDRWARILGRPSPDPTIPNAAGRPRLSPSFVEWMMGLPAGHVTGHGLRPAQELKMLGNGVCPQQAELALRMITAP